MAGLSGPTNAPLLLQMFVPPLIPPYFLFRFCEPVEEDDEGDGDDDGWDDDVEEFDVVVVSPVKSDPMIRSRVPGVRLGSLCTSTCIGYRAALSVFAWIRSDELAYSMTLLV